MGIESREGREDVNQERSIVERLRGGLAEGTVCAEKLLERCDGSSEIADLLERYSKTGRQLLHELNESVVDKLCAARPRGDNKNPVNIQ